MSTESAAAQIPGSLGVDARLDAVISALAERLLTDRPGQAYRLALMMVDRALLRRALLLTRGNQLRAARLLGLNRNTLRKRVRELGLLVGERRGGRDPASPASVNDA